VCARTWQIPQTAALGLGLLHEQHAALAVEHDHGRDHRRAVRRRRARVCSVGHEVVERAAGAGRRSVSVERQRRRRWRLRVGGLFSRSGGGGVCFIIFGDFIIFILVLAFGGLVHPTVIGRRRCR
jgi:hypothetical protein